MATEPTTFSIAEAALELDVTERRVRQLIEEGRLTPETDGMGRQRITKAQLANELKRRGRVSVKSLPGLPAGPTVNVDPLLARLDETNDLLRELISVVTTIRQGREITERLTRGLTAVLDNQQALMASSSAASPEAPAPTTPGRRRTAKV
ncbi:MAG: hypothetical protein ACXVYY_01265 [Oryzihumus sp.]